MPFHPGVRAAQVAIVRVVTAAVVCAGRVRAWLAWFAFFTFWLVAVLAVIVDFLPVVLLAAPIAEWAEFSRAA
jgi:hypothetical protein